MSIGNNIVNNHEKISNNLKVMKSQLDHVMNVFEVVDEKYIDTIRAHMLDEARDLVNTLEE